MNRISITDAATFAGIPREKARYWSTLLDLAIEKDGRVSYLQPGAENLLLAMAHAVAGGLSPSVAAVDCKAVHALPKVQEVDRDNAVSQIVDLQNAIMLLAATVEKQSKVIEQQAKAIEQQTVIICRQTSRMDLIAAKLLPMPEKPVKVWQPQSRQAPQVSTLKKLWLELFNPAMLRATP